MKQLNKRLCPECHEVQGLYSPYCQWCNPLLKTEIKKVLVIEFYELSDIDYRIEQIKDEIAKGAISGKGWYFEK